MQASWCSTPWGGTTTGCRPSAASRTTSACAVNRRAPTPNSMSSRAARTSSPSPAANFVELCERHPDRRGREGLRGPLAPSPDCPWTGAQLPDHRRARTRRVSQRAFLRNLARGGAYQSEAPTLWDVTFPDRGRAGRTRDRGASGRVPPGRVPPWSRPGLHRDHPARTSPPASRWWPTQTTSATSRCSAKP